MILGATTSVQDSGLLDRIVQGFQDSTGYRLKPVVGGSGQTLETARRGEFDVILTHSPMEEQQFVADGEGLDPREVMRDYFLIAGPDSNPAEVKGLASLGEAFRRIATSSAGFISRGDNSGTNQRELSIWQKLKIDPKGQPWYQESAVGQGQNLLVANDKAAYTLVDSATFIAFRRRTSLSELAADHLDPNVYRVIRINPSKHGNLNADGAKAFVDYITGSKGQALIADFGRQEYGQSLFEPVSSK